MCCGTEAGSYLSLIDSCITQLKAQGPVKRLKKKMGGAADLKGARSEKHDKVGMPQARQHRYLVDQICLRDGCFDVARPGEGGAVQRQQREFFIDNLMVRIHCIIVMIKWTGFATWERQHPVLARDFRPLE